MTDPGLFEEISADQAREAAVWADPLGRTLRREFGFGRGRVAEIRQEFCRFLYLTRIAEASLAPPPVLEKLWEERAARNSDAGSRGRPFERLGLSGLARSEAYRRTLELYRAEFAAAAPRRIWPPSEDLIRAARVHWLMLGGIGVTVLGGLFDLNWIAVPGLCVTGLCMIWLRVRGPLGLIGAGD